jgi:hypothetical protein
MKYMTVSECQAWVASQEVAIGVNGLPERYPDLRSVLRFELPHAPHQLAWLCRFISRALKPRHVSLLWVKEFGTFPSTENLHLYYRLRQSYTCFRSSPTVNRIEQGRSSPTTMSGSRRESILSIDFTIDLIYLQAFAAGTTVSLAAMTGSWEF